MLASFLIDGVGAAAKDLWSEHRIRLAGFERLFRMKKMLAQPDANEA